MSALPLCGSNGCIEMLSSSFAQDFLANLIATIIGVMLGVPTGLWLESRVESRTEQKRQQAVAQDRATRLRKLLTLIDNELSTNLEHVRYCRDQSLDLVTAVYLGSRLTDELWSAISDAGELQLIEDLELMAAVSRAYSAIRELRFIGEKYFTAGDLIRMSGSLELSDFFSGYSSGLLSKSQESLQEALGAIRVATQAI